MKIGFIGLGTMGRPMAANLVRAGYTVRVWNRSLAPVEALVALGAETAATPAEAARDVDVLISMLADDVATREVMLDAGCLATLQPGGIHLNMATISTALARELQRLHVDAGVGYVAAPVLGRVDLAEAGKLNILAAGGADLVASIQPLLDVMGQKTWYFGALPEQANAAKLASNFCIACAIEAMSESSALVRAHGITSEDFLDMLTHTLFAAPVYQGYGAMIAQDRYEPAGFKLSLGLKDVKLALAAGDETHVPMPFGGVLRDSLLEAVAHGDAGLDLAALAKVSARRGGL